MSLRKVLLFITLIKSHQQVVADFRLSDILMEQPGQAIPTEGFHEYSADVMNTSFFLVNRKDTMKTTISYPFSIIKKSYFRVFIDSLARLTMIYYKGIDIAIIFIQRDSVYE